MKRTRTDSKPWYRQFWPWFIIALPASVVVASLTTVYIAFKHADSLVNDNYYKVGLAINQTLAQDTLARELGVQAEVAFDTVSGEVVVNLSGQVPPSDKLELVLLHPVDGESDRAIQLTALGGGRYRGDLEAVPRHRYYLRLQPSAGEQWRLNGELNFDTARRVTLTPNV